MLNISIVDDEKVFRQQNHNIISQEIKKFNIECQIKVFESISSFLDYIRVQDIFDIIFLDIELGENSGVELAKYLLSKRYDSIVVFVTSHDKYMKDSFGLNVYQYILKEDVEKEIPVTLKRIVNDFYNSTLINLKTENGLSTYKINEIIYFTIQNRKIFMQTKKEYIQVYYTSLKKILPLLNDNFIFGNSQYIINMAYIKNFENGVIELNGTSICVFIPKGKVKCKYELYKGYMKRRIQTK